MSNHTGGYTMITTGDKVMDKETIIMIIDGEAMVATLNAESVDLTSLWCEVVGYREDMTDEGGEG